MRRAKALIARASEKREVTLLDYGAGNVRSVRNAIHKLGYTIKDVRGVWCEATGCASDNVRAARHGFPRVAPRSMLIDPPHMLTTSRLCQVSCVKDIENASRIIFPGVGACGQATEAVQRMGYREALIDYLKVC